MALHLLLATREMQGPRVISLVSLRTAAGAWRTERVAALLWARAHVPPAAAPSLRIRYCEPGPQAVARVRGIVLQGEADAAVHAAEELPGPDHEKLEVIAIPPRGDPRDALYSKDGATFAGLPRGARVGASGAARAAQLLELRPDLHVVPLDEAPGLLRVGGDLDAVVAPALVLSLAGRPVSDWFPPDKLVPAAGSATIAVEACAARDAGLDALAELDDPRARLQWTAERAVLRRLQAWPASNLAVFAEVTYGSVILTAVLACGPGERPIRVQRSGPAASAKQIAEAVAGALLLQEESAGSDASWH